VIPYIVSKYTLFMVVAIPFRRNKILVSAGWNAGAVAGLGLLPVFRTIGLFMSVKQCCINAEP
jgi:hypothetical protein